MKQELIEKAYEIAKERYAALGVDTDAAMDTLQKIQLSLHCWQADDVSGFEDAGALTGGIQATGNYPGRARNIEELQADIKKVISLLPGNHRLSLHASYADFRETGPADRDELEPKHFESWMKWAEENGMKLDFNSTSFSHPLSGDLTLSHPDKYIRDFWIEHSKRCREIADAMGSNQGSPSIMNLWIHDGSKDTTVNRLKYREHLKASLDEIFATKYSNMKDCLESKVFGIGLESYTVGSAEWCLKYAASRPDCISLMDNGHYHPTEVVSDKISAVLAYDKKMALHVTRGVRWDSDHVVTLTDELKEIAQEIVRCDALDKVLVGLDYFDGSINRVAAWAVGFRNVQKALLMALLTPTAAHQEMQDKNDWTALMVAQEEMKTLPFGEIWNEYCRRCGKPEDGQWFQKVLDYEKNVQLKRN